MSGVHARIVTHLDALHLEYRELEHEPTPTSEDSARARGEPLWTGAKAIVLKAGDRFALCVFRATRRLDSGALKRALGSKRVRFATAAELLELTGLVPGSVPPFGEPVLPLPLYLDASVADGERVAFNAGALTRSIVMPTEAYLRAVEPAGTLELTKEA